MKLTISIKLVPSPEQRDALLETIRRFNAACNYVSDKAWQHRKFRKFDLQRTDLVYKDGEFYLFATSEIDEPEPGDVQQYLGIDVGIANIAADSEGNLYGAEALIRKRMHLLAPRRKLQKAKTARRKCKRSTRSVRRGLKAIRRRERNYSRTVSHTVAKRIVATAKAFGYGIAMEKLNGIRSRARFCRKQRYLLHSWCFRQLQQMIQYKAQLAGVPVVYVEPSYTSQTCSSCGYRDKHNRISQALFLCHQCKAALHADVNGACNIAGRTLVNGPDARAA